MSDRRGQKDNYSPEEEAKRIMKTEKRREYEREYVSKKRAIARKSNGEFCANCRKAIAPEEQAPRKKPYLTCIQCRDRAKAARGIGVKKCRSKATYRSSSRYTVLQIRRIARPSFTKANE